MRLYQIVEQDEAWQVIGPHGAMLGARRAAERALALVRATERAHARLMPGEPQVAVVEWHPTTRVGAAAARALGGKAL